MTLSLYYHHVRALRKTSPCLREGQAHMITLGRDRPDLHRLITNTEDDPFYDNRRMSRFKSKLAQLWDPPSNARFSSEEEDDSDEPITINLDLSWPFL